MIFLSVLCVFVRFSLHTHLLVFTRALYALSRAKKDLGETFQFWYENSILMKIWHYTYFNIRAKILKKNTELFTKKYWNFYQKKYLEFFGRKIQIY